MEMGMMTQQKDDALEADFEATRQRVNAPCFVDKGWQQIVVDAVAKIDWLERRNGHAKVDWEEIKEWHGTLSMRYRVLGVDSDDIVVRLIADVVVAAKARADKVCIVCGEASDGEFQYKGDTLRVLCATHRAQA
jgi:hypothetical protein